MKVYFVDSFTTQRFKGNPAAVCLVEENFDVITMQNIATEIGFSETAFIKKVNDTDNNYTIRFFTPKMEISLCGHATLAASKIIFDTTNLQNITFVNCEKVELKIGKVNDKIVMQFPVYDTTEINVPQSVLEAIGIEKTVDTRFNPDLKIIILEIDDTETLVNLKPDYFALINSYTGIAGVLVTAYSKSEEFDFHYRYFWPWAGTNEDPVTGAVQTFLTKYWAKKLNKQKLNAFQSSARTGIMTTELFKDKVVIYGDAVVVFEGILT
jgi:PhzF family phenazine biosynthesis protein